MSDTGWPESPADRAERRSKIVKYAHESNDRSERESCYDEAEREASEQWVRDHPGTTVEDE